MNLQAIKRHCLATKRCHIYNALHGGQWMSNGICAFKVEGVEVDEASVAPLFNLSAKQEGNMWIAASVQSDPRFRAVTVEDEEETDVEGAIVWGDEAYLALHSDRGLLYIPLSAVMHIKEDRRRYGIRWRMGRPLVAVYSGLLCELLILPVDTGQAKRLRLNAERLSAPVFEWPDAEKEAEAAEADAERLLNGMGGVSLCSDARGTERRAGYWGLSIMHVCRIIEHTRAARRGSGETREQQSTPSVSPSGCHLPGACRPDLTENSPPDCFPGVRSLKEGG